MIEHKNATAKRGFILLLKSYGAVWLFYIGFFTVLGILSKWYPELISNKYKQEGIQDLLNNHPFKLLISAVIVAPIFEEIMFRSLIKPKYEELLLFISGWLGFLFMLFSEGFLNYYTRLVGMFILFISSYYILQAIISKSGTIQIENFLSKNVYFILIITSVVFGMAHIYNYVDTFLLNSALFVMIVPRIILGGIAGWLKLKSGALIWPILLHFLNNGFIIAILLAVKYGIIES